MKKIEKILNIVLLSLILVGDLFYILMGQNIIEVSNVVSILTKSFTSLLFVAVGVVNFIAAVREKNNINFAAILLTGLVFAMLGDIILEIQFIIGALLFGIGHIFFFVSYCAILRFRIRDLIYGMAVFMPSLLIILFAPFLKFTDNIMLIVCIVYALVISMMLGKAISNIVQVTNKQTIITLIGSLLFFISDMMLLFSQFGGVPLTGIFCLLTYYPAEFLLAYSIHPHNR